LPRFLRQTQSKDLHFTPLPGATNFRDTTLERVAQTCFEGARPGNPSTGWVACRQKPIKRASEHLSLMNRQKWALADGLSLQPILEILKGRERECLLVGGGSLGGYGTRGLPFWADSLWRQCSARSHRWSGGFAHARFSGFRSATTSILVPSSRLQAQSSPSPFWYGLVRPWQGGRNRGGAV
jgi:hypothetical protein